MYKPSMKGSSSYFKALESRPATESQTLPLKPSIGRTISTLPSRFKTAISEFKETQQYIKRTKTYKPPFAEKVSYAINERTYPSRSGTTSSYEDFQTK